MSCRLLVPRSRHVTTRCVHLVDGIEISTCLTKRQQFRTTFAQKSAYFRPFSYPLNRENELSTGKGCAASLNKEWEQFLTRPSGGDRSQRSKIAAMTFTFFSLAASFARPLFRENKQPLLRKITITTPRPPFPDSGLYTLKYHNFGFLMHERTNDNILTFRKNRKQVKVLRLELQKIAKLWHFTFCVCLPQQRWAHNRASRASRVREVAT